MSAFIEASYSTHITINVERIEKELSISWGDVERFDIRYYQLRIWMKDGSYHEVDVSDGLVTDTKWPSQVKELDADHNEIEDEEKKFDYSF